MKPVLRPTLSDVARMARVSVATASRALSNPDLVAEGTRKAVREAADSCGYKINLIARSLRIQRTDTILVLVPGIDSPFYPEIIRSLEDCAHAAGFSVILGFTSKSEERRRTYYELLSNGRVDGVIVVDGGEEALAGIGSHPWVPAVQILNGADDQQTASVRVDDRHVAELAVRHLIGLGHRRIAHIAGGATSSAARLRREGFLATMDALGLPGGAAMVRDGNYRSDDGATAMAELLATDDPPTAVFCANDSSACGAVLACRERGLRIPGDISIVGVDDTIDGRLIDPPLTTVRLPRKDIGERAMQKLIGLVSGKPDSEIETVLPVELVQRQSTAPPLPG